MSTAPKQRWSAPSVEDLGAEQDHPGAGAERRQAVGEPLGERVEQAADSSSIDIVVDSPPGRTSASTSSRSAGVRTSRGSAPSGAQARGVRGEGALQGEHADLHLGASLRTS